MNNAVIPQLYKVTKRKELDDQQSLLSIVIIMQFFRSLVSAFFCASVMAAPAPTSYSLITLHSGNEKVHLRPIGFSETGVVGIDATNAITVFFDSDKLGVTGAHGLHGAQVHFHVNDDNSIVVNDDGTDGFSLDQTHVAFNGKEDFGVCVDDSKLYINEGPASCSEFVEVGILATEVAN